MSADSQSNYLDDNNIDTNSDNNNDDNNKKNKNNNNVAVIADGCMHAKHPCQTVCS